MRDDHVICIDSAVRQFSYPYLPTHTYLDGMSLANILQRRVKPRKYDSDDDEASSTQHESELEKPGFDDSLSSSEISEDGESRQQHQRDEAGSSHESVRHKPSHFEHYLILL